jgi:hypothetical protein
VKPTTLTLDAITVWDGLAPICLAMGTLTVADVRAFTTLCELEANLALARRWKADPKTRAAGLKLEKKFASDVRPFYEAFGLTPMSRSRIKVPKADEAPVSKWAGVLR